MVVTFTLFLICEIYIFEVSAPIECDSSTSKALQKEKKKK